MTRTQTAVEYTRVVFPKFGVNKQREISRLIHEISKRDKISFDAIIPPSLRSYQKIKSRLLKLRYPENFNDTDFSSYYLPKLEIRAENKARPPEYFFEPSAVYIEEAAFSSEISRRTVKKFPEAEIKIISSAKDYLKNKSRGIEGYNNRRKNLFIINELYDFYKPCPCTQKAANCGYNLMNLGFGCPYDCSYCFLQQYQNLPGIAVPANIDDFFAKFDETNLNKGIYGKARIGTGEFCDSLALDSLTGYSTRLIEFFRDKQDIFFEFKTKSANVENIIKCKPAENITASWSVNPKKVIDSCEFMTPSLEERISAAQKCSEAGFKVGFHFDPIIRYKEWENDYKETVNLIFDRINFRQIAWISAGTLRFNPGLKTIIENRFPENTILDEELILGFDGKMRYRKTARLEIYNKISEWIKKRAPEVFFYLCMEELEEGKWETVNGRW